MVATVGSALPRFEAVTPATLKLALRRGWHDLRRAPLYALVLAGVYVAMGWIMVWVTRATGQTYWLVLAAVGFPLIAPFCAVAFYEISRRLAGGAPLEWGGITGVVLHQARGQLPYVGGAMLVVFLCWFFLGHMIFAIFLGLSPMTNISHSLDVFLTPEGLMMLAVGSVVGAGFATLLFMVTVLSMPLLLDRDVDFMTAMITSFAYVRDHAAVMFGWAAFIAVVTFVSMLPGFFGLFVTLPLLGHATWHLYALLAEPDQRAG